MCMLARRGRLRLRLLERVLVGGRWAAAVDRLERRLLVAWRSRHRGGAVLPAEGVALYVFWERFRFLFFPALVRSCRAFDFQCDGLLRLMVFPVILGSGKRLFAASGKKPLTLIDATPGAGVQILIYERA